jgi:hypothetical protein
MRPDTQTPGQIAYEAYLRTWNIPGLRTWEDEPRVQQRAWEAAAQAVLAWQAQEEAPLPATRTSTFVAQQLAALAQLPCRLEVMTAREYAIYQALIPAVAALQTLAGWDAAAQAVLARCTPEEGRS